ncbi:MAG: hypothetical protein HY255_02225 [Betaproteobacteria bacterium]|nr:hypothetical protein [Betaproteobacteria bacterium]
MGVEQTELMRFLDRGTRHYSAKVLEVREAIAGWLTYIPATFPHYTRHTLEHSEEIISQLSSVLFRSDGTPALPLSEVEAFILCLAAYLHDAGMVCSDGEKATILESADWLKWVEAGGGGHKRWQEILTAKANLSADASGVESFWIDRQIRFLVAEFVRARHHSRAGDLITARQSEIGRFAYDNQILIRTVADVCVAHGLDKQSLNDPERYPELRDVRGEKVNVRFLAHIFRIGDLLDMSEDRACPLLLSAACPLPMESLAHWTQYGCITHRATSPDRIEITAECSNQLEHRWLADWCQWLVDECKESTFSMIHSQRHKGWVAPTASINEMEPSIAIRPKKTATYIPSKWNLRIDETEILKRLIFDTYPNPLDFVRELLQNAIDASRCAFYAERNGPTPVEHDFEGDPKLDEYPISVGLQEYEGLNEMSGERELRQRIVIEDNGIGVKSHPILTHFSRPNLTHQ